MKEDLGIKDLVNKAEKSLNASNLLLEKGFYDFAVARAYYTMFYLVEAILLTKGLSFSKHKGVIAAFGEHFAKPEIVPKHLHRYLIDAHDLRQIGDYGLSKSIPREKVQETVVWADEFYRETVAFLKASGYEI